MAVKMQPSVARATATARRAVGHRITHRPDCRRHPSAPRATASNAAKSLTTTTWLRLYAALREVNTVRGVEPGEGACVQTLR